MTLSVKNYFVTSGRILVLLLLASSFFTACSKNKTTHNKSIAGTWEGKWGGMGEEPQYFIKFQVKNDGTLVRLSEQGEVTANGTWSLNGIEFQCSYVHTNNGEKHNIAGLYTDFDGVIIGTWGYNGSKADGGTIDLMKQ